MSSLRLFKKEVRDLAKFAVRHYLFCQGEFELESSSCGIGISVIVRCTDCNVTKNITDHDTW